MRNDKQFDFSKVLNLIGSNDKKSKQEAAENIRSRLSNEENHELNTILNDKSKIDAILKSSAAQQIIKKINGNSDGKHQ